MATLMEKDVLIEVIADAWAISIKKHLYDTPEADRLAELRKYVYKSSHKDIDYQAIIEEVKKIKATLESLPDLSGGIYD